MPELINVHLSDEEILNRLRNFEDSFVERKSLGDWRKDAAKTIVAFANSCPPGFPGILFIGVRSNGEIEENKDNLDSLEIKLGEETRDIYPQIYYFSRVLTEGGKQFLAVLVPGSDERPHFTGHSYVRINSQSRKASEEQFAELIATRNSTAYEILRWREKEVLIELVHPHMPGRYPQYGKVVRCNQFYVTISIGGNLASHPLERVILSFDHKDDQLKLEITSR